MPKPAARVTDMTQHGGMIVPPTAMFTMIENLPAARVGDNHVCPAVTVLVPHVGGPIILGSFTVFIENMPAARVQDMLVCVGPPDMIAMGAMSTFIGDSAGGAMTTMPPPPNAPPAGAPPGKSTAEGDPVDVATGQMFTQCEDFLVPGPPAFSATRFYSAFQHAQSGPFGFGWSSRMNERLEVTPEAITYHTWAGREILFVPIPPDEQYLYHLDEKIMLRREDSGYVVEEADGRQLFFEAAADARTYWLTRVRDFGGREITIERAEAMPQRVRDSSGGEWLWESGNGREVNAIRYRAPQERAESLVMLYRYDSAGNLCFAQDALGQTQCYEYDALHRLVQKTDRNNFAVSFAYDAHDRCVRTWAQNGLFDLTFSYHETEPMTTVRDSRGSVTHYFHNPFGLVTCKADALGHQERFDYEGTNLVVRTDALGRAARFGYDKHGRIVKRSQPGGGEVMTVHTPMGVKVIGADGAAMVWQQQAGKAWLSLEGAPTFLWTGERSAEDHSVVWQDSLGNGTRLSYDAMDRVDRVVLPSGLTYRYDYDKRGDWISLTGPSGASIRFGYDSLHRLTTMERDSGSPSQFRYAGEGEWSHFVNGNGHTTRMEHDGLGRLIAVTNPLGQTVRYGYESGSRLARIEDARNAETCFDYDASGHVQRIVYPDGQSDVFTFDSAGQLAHFEGRGGLGGKCGYDADGNLTALRYADDTTLEFAWDKSGRLATAGSRASQIGFAYDGLGRLVCETQNGIAITYRYDAAGRLSATEIGGEAAAQFSYNADGRSSFVTDWDGGRHGFEYDEAGAVSLHRFPNRLVARAQNSRLGLPLQVGLGRERDPRPLALCRYRYDSNDAMTESMDSTFGRTAFRLDALGRVQSVQHDDHALNETFVHDQANRLQSGPGIRCRHDARGNVIELDSEGQRGLRLSYNQQNLLTRAVLPDSSAIEYHYDPFGRRVLERHGDRETRFLWSGDLLLREWTLGPEGALTEQRDYIYHPVTKMPIGLRIGTDVYCFHCDARGAPTRVSASTGAIVWAADYSVFGEARIHTAQIEHSLRLPGHTHDADTGFDFVRGRPYHPGWGRYLSPDPAVLLTGANPYLPARPYPEPHSLTLGVRAGQAARAALAAACLPTLTPSLRQAVMPLAIRPPEPAVFTAWPLLLAAALEQNGESLLPRPASGNTNRVAAVGSAEILSLLAQTLDPTPPDLPPILI